MNLEINIKVPLGAADVSIARSSAQMVPEPMQYAPTDAFPPALDPGRHLPWGEPLRPNGAEAMAPEAGPPSLEELGVVFEAQPDPRPPSLKELGGDTAFMVVNVGVPPGLEELDLPAAALAAVEAPPPPEFELEAQAAFGWPAPPPPDELIQQTRPTKAPSEKQKS